MGKRRTYQSKTYEELLALAQLQGLTLEQVIEILLEDLQETEDYLARRRKQQQPWTKTDERLTKKQPALAQALAWLKANDQEEMLQRGSDGR